MVTKVCSKCKEELDISQFGKNRSKKNGIQSQCKKCEKEFKTKNRDHIREFDRKYKKEHKQQTKEYNSKYREIHKKEIEERRKKDRDYYKLYRETKKNEKQLYDRQYRTKNKTRIAERVSKKFKLNCETSKEFKHKFEGRRYVTFALKPNIVKRDGYKCSLCGSEKDLKSHHIKPVKTSPDLIEEVSNLAIVCKDCHLYKCHDGNWQKINKSVAKYLEAFVLYSYGVLCGCS